MSESLYLSVVIPAFNEQAGIVSTLERVTEYLGAQAFDWEVVVVDDGSSDRTAAVVDEWSRGRTGVRVESIPHRGKGWAVRHGMLASAGRYRFMCDADLAMPIDGLPAFLERMDAGYDIVALDAEAAVKRDGTVLGLRVREALRPFDVDVDLKPTYGISGIRNYRVSGDKIGRVLGFQPSISIEDSVTDLVMQMRRHDYTDFANPRYYNIQWMTLLEEATDPVKVAGGSLFDDPAAASTGP